MNEHEALATLFVGVVEDMIDKYTMTEAIGILRRCADAYEMVLEADLYQLLRSPS